MKDHEIAAMVNELKQIAIKYHSFQCLRELISKCVAKYIKEK